MAGSRRERPGDRPVDGPVTGLGVVGSVVGVLPGGAGRGAVEHAAPIGERDDGAALHLPCRKGSQRLDADLSGDGHLQPDVASHDLQRLANLAADVVADGGGGGDVVEVAATRLWPTPKVVVDTPCARSSAACRASSSRSVTLPGSAPVPVSQSSSRSSEPRR
jgi:hypothetical protein